ncbi:mitochondrial carrier [Hyphopichia burtonii NRRL Y-1933]|uniref:Mitochondrial thiamine pyrophosphate carrier 1 n=1 Tax=Hyphopichia burtonii NRRL Y-1933 TaxID=984485 RepID=A0A1E4RHD7_9ASCO|nr:mitochondrial carrier [Hyphopichia burtonii NRRL Y-1933]ODV66631.1 mitochondrial carrier [Hyphopichia burtonii NRRL Y-1933]
MSLVIKDKEDKILDGPSVQEKAPPPKYIGFVAGMFSGVTKNAVGHPFDTVKVRLQTSEGRFKGPMDCVWQTFKAEGFRGFYKGFTPPLVGWIMMDSVMLGSLHVYRRYVKDYIYPEETKLPLMGHVMAGLGSGWTVSFVAAPIEQFKARLQVQYDAKSKIYTGPIDVAKKLFKISPTTWFAGLIPTMIFRTNFIFWWGSYELFTQYFEDNTKLLKPAINFWSGGLSATVFWIFAYPSDVIKQVIMTDSPIKSEKKFPKYSDAVKFIYREKGLAGFTRGFGPSILRSFPANAAALAAFEAVMRVLH